MVDGDIVAVSCDVVGTCQYHHFLGFEVDYILSEPEEHLCCYLSADASAGVVMSGEEERVGRPPSVGDGVAHEDHLRVAFELLVLLLISLKLRPVGLRLSLGVQVEACNAETEEKEYPFHRYLCGYQYFGYCAGDINTLIIVRETSPLRTYCLR